MKHLLHLLPALLFCLLAARCTDEATMRRLSQLDAAERLLPSNADSAALLLAGIPQPEELGNRDFARWCMLCGRATNYTHADTLSIQQWERAQKWIDKHGSPEERAQVGMFLGRAYAKDGEWDLAMQTYAEALHDAKEHKAYNVAGYICTYMADLYNFKGISDEIRAKYAEAATLFSRVNNLKSQVYAMKNLAMELAYADSFAYAKKIICRTYAEDIHVAGRIEDELENNLPFTYHGRCIFKDMKEKHIQPKEENIVPYQFEDGILTLCNEEGKQYRYTITQWTEDNMTLREEGLTEYYRSLYPDAGITQVTRTVTWKRYYPPVMNN